MQKVKRCRERLLLGWEGLGHPKAPRGLQGGGCPSLGVRAGTEGSEETKPGCETSGGEMLSEPELPAVPRSFVPRRGAGAFGGCVAPREHFLASHMDSIPRPVDSFPLSKARGAACVKGPRGRGRRVPLLCYFFVVVFCF